ncbi:MAG: NHL repeat protein [bacterium ADurb.Bin478]|nr:MAG: NHL repeat protein [bacterium ADurb.Bin478]
MKRTQYIVVAALVTALGCSEYKMPLPSPATGSLSFGANDTSYVELKPQWDPAYLGVPLQAPGDLAISADGTLYLADEGADRIYALSKAGRILGDFGQNALDAVPKPRALAMDSKLNLFIVNGTRTLYIWNQFLNRLPIDSVADSGIYFDRVKNETVQLTLEEWSQRVAAGGSSLLLRRYLFHNDPERIASARRIYPAYQDEDAAAQFNGVAAGKYGEETVYLTESHTDRILQLVLMPNLAFKGKDRSVLFGYKAVMQKIVAVYGSGSGTVDDPWAITTDSDENLYFTQLGGNFRVQKLSAATFTPRYVLYQHAIMDLERFVAPSDVALDGSNHIFVLDSATGAVTKFANSGSKAGQMLSLGKKGLALAHFQEGKGLLVSDQVVYVVERGARCIRRFQYSISESDLPYDDKQP